jgi:hypothetical protein
MVGRELALSVCCCDKVSCAREHHDSGAVVPGTVKETLEEAASRKDASLRSGWFMNV